MPNRVLVSMMSISNEEDGWRVAATGGISRDGSRVAATGGVSRDDGILPLRANGVEAFLHKAMSILNLDGEEVSVSFCTDKEIRELNKKWRGIDSPTDVLSFEDGGEYTDEDGNIWKNMGDIVISYETLFRSREETGEDEEKELKRLLVHGLLHLNGYDHGDEHLTAGEEPVCKMLKLQEKVLTQLS